MTRLEVNNVSGCQLTSMGLRDQLGRLKLEQSDFHAVRGGSNLRTHTAQSAVILPRSVSPDGYCAVELGRKFLFDRVCQCGRIFSVIPVIQVMTRSPHSYQSLPEKRDDRCLNEIIDVSRYSGSLAGSVVHEILVSRGAFHLLSAETP